MHAYSLEKYGIIGSMFVNDIYPKLKKPLKPVTKSFTAREDGGSSISYTVRKRKNWRRRRLICTV
jgi:hypothetical protein